MLTAMGNHGLLRWMIRGPGIVLVMIAGGGLLTLGYAFIASTVALIWWGQWPYALVSLTVLILLSVIGIVFFRIGWRMIKVVDETTVANFSFIFAAFIAYNLHRVLKGGWLDAHMSPQGSLWILSFGLFLFYYWLINKCVTNMLLLKPRKLE